MRDKLSAGKQSIYKNNTQNNNYFIGVVVINNDDSDANRVKVRIKGVDDSVVSDSDLPYCFPLLPKLLNIVPKVGETVFVFVSDIRNNVEDRLFIGPLISQPQKLEKDNHYYGSRAALNTGFVELTESPSTLPEAKGVFPNKEDVSVQGRKNSDIIFKDNEILLRVGKSTNNNLLKFNKDTQGYIQLKFNTTIDSENNTKGSITNIVSNKINLLTYKSKTNNFNLTNQEDYISDEEMLNILEKAHPMVFGDKLIEFLNLLKLYITNHIHPYNGMPSDKTKTVKDLLNFDLNGIISDNIKIN